MEMAAYDLITVGLQKRNMEFWTHNAMNMLGGIATMHYVLVGVCSAVARWIRMSLGLVCFSRRNRRTSPASPAVFRSLRRRDGDPSVWRGVFLSFAVAFAAAAGVIKRSEKPSGAWLKEGRKEGRRIRQTDSSRWMRKSWSGWSV